MASTNSERIVAAAKIVDCFHCLTREFAREIERQPATSSAVSKKAALSIITDNIDSATARAPQKTRSIQLPRSFMKYS